MGTRFAFSTHNFYARRTTVSVLPADFMDQRRLLEVAAERSTQRRIKRTIRTLVRVAAPLWHWGDGCGGWVIEEIASAARDAGLELPSLRLRDMLPTTRQVLERDAYRCKHCGGWEHLSVDHIQPRAKGGTDDLDNLQTLCRTCNSRKGAR